jgi:GMP synthase (glutamine-hydrolysing)
LDEKPDGILILDFGGQYCHLIARRVREMNVYSEILPCDTSIEEIEKMKDKMQIRGIILSGSPSSIGSENSLGFHQNVLSNGPPVLGLCYGHQFIAHLFGGEVRRSDRREYGITRAIIDQPIEILKGMSSTERVWMSHGDTVFSMPGDFKVLAHTDSSPVAAFSHRTIPLYGLQWHPEVVHTEKGNEMLRNFVFDICRCKPKWRPIDVAERAITEIRKAVGDSKAVIALSGGVDSSVAAALAAEALGDRLVAVHVDNGLMRHNESKNVEMTFRELGVELVVVSAQQQFLEKLRNVVDPETKRRIIGEEFIRVFESEARGKDAKYLIQGTIYPDRIESGYRRHSDKIKTHHNVGGLPLHMEFNAVIEPLRDLYKDEVRLLGKRLGLPDTLVKRQPFPGPGLAVRIIGEVTEDKLKILRRVDTIVCEELEVHGHNETIWQYFPVLTSRSTGVKGDERAYGWTIAVRIVESVDGMTASFWKAPWGLLERISTRITNEVPEITRVVYDITHKPPSTIEWE